MRLSPTAPPYEPGKGLRGQGHPAQHDGQSLEDGIVRAPGVLHIHDSWERREGQRKAKTHLPPYPRKTQ